MRPSLISLARSNLSSHIYSSYLPAPVAIFTDWFVVICVYVIDFKLEKIGHTMPYHPRSKLNYFLTQSSINTSDAYFTKCQALF